MVRQLEVINALDCVVWRAVSNGRLVQTFLLVEIKEPVSQQVGNWQGRFLMPAGNTLGLSSRQRLQVALALWLLGLGTQGSTCPCQGTAPFLRGKA